MHLPGLHHMKDARARLVRGVACQLHHDAGSPVHGRQLNAPLRHIWCRAYACVGRGSRNVTINAEVVTVYGSGGAVQSDCWYHTRTAVVAHGYWSRHTVGARIYH